MSSELDTTITSSTLAVLPPLAPSKHYTYLKLRAFRKAIENTQVRRTAELEAAMQATEVYYTRCLHRGIRAIKRFISQARTRAMYRHDEVSSFIPLIKILKI